MNTTKAIPIDRPTSSELTLLRALWTASPLSAREIHDRTKSATNWSYSSTRKTLDRMTAKRLVAERSAHGLKIYVPLASRLSTVAAMIADFGREMLDAPEPLDAAAFASSRLIEPDEVDDLQALLDDLSAAPKDRNND